jgi:hypothetical protein
VSGYGDDIKSLWGASDRRPIACNPQPSQGYARSEVRPGVASRRAARFSGAFRETGGEGIWTNVDCYEMRRAGPASIEGFVFFDHFVSHSPGRRPEKTSRFRWVLANVGSAKRNWRYRLRGVDGEAASINFCWQFRRIGFAFDSTPRRVGPRVASGSCVVNCCGSGRTGGHTTGEAVGYGFRHHPWCARCYIGDHELTILSIAYALARSTWAPSERSGLMQASK